MNHPADALPDPAIERRADRLAEQLAVVIPFPPDRRRDPAEAEARRRHPSARTI